MEDEIDIYADLPSFNLGDNENLVEKNKKITEKCTNLEKQVAELNERLESIQKINNNLEVNLSSLLQTAKAEIARKDRMIADIRQRLDDMQFRRGDYGRSSKPSRHSPQRIKRENTLEEKSRVVQVPEVPDVTEFVCSDPPPLSINEDDKNSKKSHNLNGIVSTVFGERLRKRILEEQEEERKQKEQSKARADLDSKKIPDFIKQVEISGSDTRNCSKADDLKKDDKIDNRVRPRNKASSLGFTDAVGSEQNGNSAKQNYFDRKRQSEDQAQIVNGHKKSKSNDGRSRYRDSSRHRNRETRSSLKNKSDEPTSGEILSDFHIVDEYEAPVETDLRKTTESINTVDESENQDRHNRVAIRLMLLAEGIDPDIQSKKAVENEQIKVVEDKRQSCKRSREASRSRSKSRNRPHNHRSRSRTPDQHWRSRQRGNRYRRSRDRFERRRDSKNKEGDNLSEFSREISELKEKIEHRGDDRSSDRAGKGRNFIRHKRNDDKIYKIGKSKTPDRSRSGSKERPVHSFRDHKQYRRSRSRDRHKSRNRGKHYSNSDDVSIRHSKDIVSGTEKTENADYVSEKTSLEVAENPETKSLVSLEDGEIVDSAESSPMKIVEPVKSLTERIRPPNCKLNSLDSEESEIEITDDKSSLPLREIGNNQKIETLSLVEKPILPIPDANQCINLDESLNSSKSERIENIAEFIANFDTDVSESKIYEKSDDNIIQNDVTNATQMNIVPLKEEAAQDKIRCSSNTLLQDSSKDIPPLSPPIENGNAVTIMNVNGITKNDDWCLIAIDSPIKNFEENHRNRIMALNSQIENSEPSEIVTTDNVLPEHSNVTSEKLCADESNEKIVSKVEKVVSENITKPLVQPIKSISKNKLPVLKSLKSTYHKGRKEIILSDTNSEHCTKISTHHSMNSAIKRLSNEPETVQQNKDNGNKSLVETNNIEKTESRSPVDKDVYGSDEKQNLIGIRIDSTRRIGDMEHTGDTANVARNVDERTKKTGKSKMNTNNKTNREMVTKIGGNLKSERSGSGVRESKGKQSAACKTESSCSSEAEVTRSTGSKNETASKVGTIDENEELKTINKSSENAIKQAKAVTKAKDEGNNSKLKKEPQKLIFSARRRKPVHLEDSSMPLNVVMSPNSLRDNINNSDQCASDNAEPSNLIDGNSKAVTEHGDNQTEETNVKNDSSHDHQSEL